MAEKFHIVTAVWGQRFVERFLTTTIPTIITENNLGALTSQSSVTYTIYTTAEDEENLRQASIIEVLKNLVDVRFQDVGKLPEDGKYTRATRCYQRAFVESWDMDAGTIILTPDAIWCDGILRRVMELVEGGYKAILADGLRVDRESFSQDFDRAFSASEDGSISVESKKLMKVALRSIHPYEAAVLWGSPKRHDVSYRLHWPIPGEGIITRGFCNHPLFIKPEKRDFEFVGAIDHGLVGSAVPNSDEIYYADGTDEIGIVSIDDIGFSGENYKISDRNSRILNVAKWAFHDATMQNLAAAEHPFRRNFVKPTTEKWRRAEKLSGRHMDEILTCRNLMVLLEKMESLDLHTAAEILAYALNEPVLIGWLGKSVPMTLLIPTDDALSSFEAPKSHKELRSMIFSYILDGHHSAEEVRKKFPENVIAKSDIEVGDWLIHVIDRPI